MSPDPFDYLRAAAALAFLFFPLALRCFVPARLLDARATIFLAVRLLGRDSACLTAPAFLRVFFTLAAADFFTATFFFAAINLTNLPK